MVRKWLALLGAITLVLSLRAIFLVLGILFVGAITGAGLGLIATMII